MATIQEVLADKKTYADDLKWDLGNGVAVTVGDLRSSVMSKGAVKDIEERYAKEKNELQQAYQIAMTNMQQERQQTQAQQVSQQAGGDGLEPFMNDPYWRPLAQKAQMADTLAKRMEMLEKRIQSDEQAVLTDRYSQVLRSLKEKDPDLDVSALAGFAQSRQIYNLDDAYRLHTEEKRFAKATQEAEARGYQKAKAEPPLPPMPRGGMFVPPADAPTSLNEGFEALKRDPMLQSIYHGE